MSTKREPRVTQVRIADENNAVITVEGGKGDYCREPCPECPWKKANTGKFPAKAFLISANTANDMAQHTFGCHMAGREKPKTCAGFILRGGHDNLAVHIAQSKDRMNDVQDGGHDLHESYLRMAVANGCDEGDPALARVCPEHKYGREAT